MIAIVGGAGFIGSRLSEILKEQKIEYSIVDKADSPFDEVVKTDIRNENGIKSALDGADVIINLAAEHRDDVTPLSLYWDVNVEGARNIVAAAEKLGINKIVFTSSVAVYGFAPAETDENGDINPFNEYGKTKFEAEKIYKEWQSSAPEERTLIIVRPTVVFGEKNRGNVYNLLKQIATGFFVMIGAGRNKKSMAYVGNVAAFLFYSLRFEAGVHLYNYVDKPDYDMNSLVALVKGEMNYPKKRLLRIPYGIGVIVGYFADLAAKMTNKKLPLSLIRVKKFCATTQFATSIEKTGFKRPFSLNEGLRRTIKYEFVECHRDEKVFYSE